MEPRNHCTTADLPRRQADLQSNPQVEGTDRLQRLRLGLAMVEQHMKTLTEEIANEMRRLGSSVDPHSLGQARQDVPVMADTDDDAVRFRFTPDRRRTVVPMRPYRERRAVHR
jgi:hypothetical protein